MVEVVGRESNDSPEILPFSPDDWSSYTFLFESQLSSNVR